MHFVIRTWSKSLAVRNVLSHITTWDQSCIFSKQMVYIKRHFQSHDMPYVDDMIGGQNVELYRGADILKVAM